MIKNSPITGVFSAKEWASAYVYVAHADLLAKLQHELAGQLIGTQDDLLFSLVPPNQIVFAQDVWYEPQWLIIESIGDAIKKLKAIHSHWYPHVTQMARRTMLIAEGLRAPKKFKVWNFPLSDRLPHYGVFTLLDQQTVLYSIKREKSVPDGCFNFVEDKVNPPNRAYLKLWEALSILKRYPKRGEFALDLGASPGGWTYVLQSFGATVLAVDKAPLAPHIARLPNVKTELASAFSLSPQDFSHIDWLVCDVACYPEKLYRWLLPWIESGKVKQFIVTMKLQGETDFTVLEQFKKIPNGRVIHLYNNKHEVTFFWPC